MSEELDNEITAISEPSSGNLLAPVETQVTFLDENSPTNDLLQALDTINYYQQNLKKLKPLVEAALIARIKRDGPIEFGGGVKYVLGKSKTTKCRDIAKTVETLLTHCGGDFTRFCSFLSANAVKYGAAKGELEPAIYESLFETVVKDSLEEPKLTRLDERFNKAKPRKTAAKPEPLPVPPIDAKSLPF